jgi:hypothetical protein
MDSELSKMWPGGVEQTGSGYTSDYTVAEGAWPSSDFHRDVAPQLDANNLYGLRLPCPFSRQWGVNRFCVLDRRWAGGGIAVIELAGSSNSISTATFGIRLLQIQRRHDIVRQYEPTPQPSNVRWGGNGSAFLVVHTAGLGGYRCVSAMDNGPAFLCEWVNGSGPLSRKGACSALCTCPPLP